MPQPFLTLAIIVKDQADLLERLLRDHRTLYDEAVVVDTGSRDRSPEVARDLGARLISSQWRHVLSMTPMDVSFPSTGTPLSDSLRKPLLPVWLSDASERASTDVPLKNRSSPSATRLPG